jgi:hypothetical protein
LRLSEDGTPYILEVNSNPDLGPDAGVAFQLDAAGISLDGFIVRMVENAIRRKPIVRREQSSPCDDHQQVAFELRPLLPQDRKPIQEILQQCENFRPEEVQIGLELVDEATSDPSASDYRFIVAASEGRVLGYSCFGPVPAAEGVWDLYWIAVDPAGGRMILAETSSLPNYADARTFYLKQGYQLCDRIADFYRPGDDRMTFGKRL